jgi:Protein of unknown function (DUF4246)
VETFTSRPRCSTLFVSSRSTLTLQWLTGSQCISELRDKAINFEKTGRINIFDAELTIVKSDSAISDSLRSALREAVKPLEDVPDFKKDWHPGSDQKVLDLLHPSLYPVVYGLTRALRDETVPLNGCIEYIGKGITIDEHAATVQSSNSGKPLLWGSYQWLPAEMELTDEGAKITSYINNLHPEKHEDLYKVLEKIATATIPMWEDCLSGFGDRRRFEINYTGADDWYLPKGLMYRVPGRQGDNALVEGNKYDPKEDDWRWEDDFNDWKVANRILTYREPREYVRQADLRKGQDPTHRNGTFFNPVLNLKEKFPNGLQVIFKLANIHLTPEEPKYKGGTWHVEGALNEMICASAIYYYDQENITDSYLAFRQSIDYEELMMIAEQNEFASLEAYLGIENDGPALQPLGRVLTREGRMVVFPNCIHHQVQPFKLRDASKPGHRKILAMFLVDPNKPILSTANVPPQRRDWWAEKLRNDGVLPELPDELFDHVVAVVPDFPISWAQAVEIRENLMAERGALNDSFDEYVFSVSDSAPEEIILSVLLTCQKARV